MNIETIESIFNDHEKVLQKSRTLFPVILDMADICRRALAEGHKILICGNGGSAADAQHIAAEFVGRFHNERVSLPSIALTTDTSILTAVANDYSYDRVFARQVEGLGNKGDVLWGISTSGNSRNVNEALKTARQKGLEETACCLHKDRKIFQCKGPFQSIGRNGSKFIAFLWNDS
jgi:D-sedoheptulose 7-phosphate isomerase